MYKMSLLHTLLHGFYKHIHVNGHNISIDVDQWKD